jgi:hypothetical protein
MERTISVDDAIAFLNEALLSDGNAIAALFKVRVGCNAELAAHPTLQVCSGPLKADERWGQHGLGAGEFDIGVLGLLNGLFGIDGRGSGFIAARYEDDGSISRFVRTPGS